MAKIIEYYGLDKNNFDYVLVECSCRTRFYIHLNESKKCSCGKEYKIERKLVEIIKEKV